jgi:hypothetical protein
MSLRASIFKSTATTLLAATALMLISCRPDSPKPVPEKHTIYGWRPVVSWSGHGNTQTESFPIGSGQWRIKWETSNEISPGKGRFKVIVHSLVSGRFVMVAADHQGVGKDVAYLAEEPRQFFLDIESHDIDWKISVEEGVIGEQ